MEPSDEQLALAVAPALGVPAGQLRFCRCPTGKFNTTWFVDASGRPCVLRVAPPEDRSRMLFYEHRMMLQEPGLHRRLREGTGAPVPEVLALVERDEVLGRDFIVMERLPGRPLTEAETDLPPGGHERLLEELGKELRAVHRLTADRYGYRGEHAPMEPQATWVEAFEIMWHRLLDDIEACGGYRPEEVSLMRSVFDRHRDRFREREVPPSLLHMDVWAQNILTDAEGRLTGLIDWDRALWGDPEIEYAVLDFCRISKPAFWDGYGERPGSGESFHIRRSFYFLYEIQKYIVIRIQRYRDRDAAEPYRQTSLETGRMLAAG